jgi:hypothetical protein
LKILVGGNDNLSTFGRYLIKLLMKILGSIQIFHFDHLQLDRSRLLVFRKLLTVVDRLVFEKTDCGPDNKLIKDSRFWDFDNDKSRHNSLYATRNQDLFKNKRGAISREDFNFLTIRYIISIGI